MNIINKIKMSLIKAGNKIQNHLCHTQLAKIETETQSKLEYLGMMPMDKLA